MQLETKRLILSEYEPDDWRETLEYQSIPRYLRYYPWESRAEGDVREFVAKFVSQRYEQPRSAYQLAITLRESGRLIGSCGIRVTDFEHGRANIGYEIDPRHWSSGYATEAAREMVHFGFHGLGMTYISAECLAENAGSVRVLEKLQMRLVFRGVNKETFKGRAWDSLVYAIEIDPQLTGGECS